jgi:hypothetical protein
LFGKLEKGGLVRVDAADEKLVFTFAPASEAPAPPVRDKTGA